MKTKIIAKCADTGRIVSPVYAKANPGTTYFLTVPVRRQEPADD